MPLAGRKRCVAERNKPRWVPPLPRSDLQRWAPLMETNDHLTAKHPIALSPTADRSAAAPGVDEIIDGDRELDGELTAGASELAEFDDLDTDDDWEETWVDRGWVALGDFGWPRIFTFATVVASVGLILWVLHPDLILKDSTPTGGDMGAHVWGPAYLRDHLLPHWRLSGWAPDWYAGFPAFQFYMVLPSLLDRDPKCWVRVYPRRVHHRRRWRCARGCHTALTGLPRTAGGSSPLRLASPLLVVGMPYGVAFKIVAALGVTSMPLSAYLLGRLHQHAVPAAGAFLSVAMLPFVFDRSFNIIGGNIASTMAGEFAFSLSISLSLIYIGLMYRALEDPKFRSWAALFFASTALCHLLVAFVIDRRHAHHVWSCDSAATSSNQWCSPAASAAHCARSGSCRFTPSGCTSTTWVGRRPLRMPMPCSCATSPTQDATLADSPPFRVVFVLACAGLLLADLPAQPNRRDARPVRRGGRRAPTVSCLKDGYGMAGFCLPTTSTCTSWPGWPSANSPGLLSRPARSPRAGERSCATPRQSWRSCFDLGHARPFVTGPAWRAGR